MRRPIYRYSTVVATMGGPVNLGKLMRGRKDKVFFFYSFEKSWVKNPQAVRQVTVPSALERTGDYSQTVDVNNRPILIRDPLSNANFPNNVIPASRIDRNGQAMLNIFPLPTQLNRAVTGWGTSTTSFKRRLISRGTSICFGLTCGRRRTIPLVPKLAQNRGERC